MSNSFCPDSWVLARCVEESPAEESGVEASCAALDNLAPEVQDVVILAAKEFLWNATGQRFGLCEATYRPCDPGCYDQSTYRGWSGIPRGAWGGYWGWTPYIFNGNWFNMVCGDCNGNRCTHQNLSKVKLPQPLDSVVEVLIDGAPFADWEYNVNYGLVRTDGQHWPRTQDFTKPLSEPDTFGVTVMAGIPVPAGGQLAAGLLACEMAKAACNDGSCQLPKRVQTIVRQGVTVAFQDNFSMLYGKNGPLTGIWGIDQWIASVNYSARRRSRLLTPDAAPTWKQ